MNAEGEVFGVKGGSGGYLEYIFKRAAKELFGKEIERVEYKAGRNPDLKTVTLEVDGQVRLNFATAYGFRNIQNLVRRIKKGDSPFHFVEVMACPSGCLNGGGQIKPKDGQSAKELVKKLDAIYHEQQREQGPEENDAVGRMYEEWLGDRTPFSEKARKALHTQYHAREKIVNALAIKW